MTFDVQRPFVKAGLPGAMAAWADANHGRRQVNSDLWDDVAAEARDDLLLC